MDNARSSNTGQLTNAITLSLLTFLPFFYIYSEVLFSLTNWWWTTSKYAHSLIIFPAIIYLIYEQRQILSAVPLKPDFLALIPLVFSTTLLSMSNYIDVQIITQTLFVAIIPLILWAIMGRKIITIIALPLALLITVAPIWELFAPLLTEFTARVAHLSLNLLGVPVFKDEMYLTIPEGVFLIAEGCGGFRYFISGLSLGLIFAHLNYNSFKQQALIVLFAVLLSILTNWIRVMIVIWAGHVTDMQHPYVRAHVNLGWYVFAIAFFLYFFICNRFIPHKAAKQKVSPKTSVSQKPSVHKNTLIGGLTLLALLSPWFIIAKISSPSVDVFPLHNFGTVTGWDSPQINKSNWRPQFNGSTQQQVATYTKKNLSVDIYYALYQDQSQGNELINFNNSITNKEWVSFNPKDALLSPTNNSKLTVKKIRANTQQGELTILTWYRISAIESSNSNIAKLLELKKIISTNKLSMVFAVSTLQDINTPETLSSIESLLQEIYPEIINHFESTE
jgi:exosortase A